MPGNQAHVIGQPRQDLGGPWTVKFDPKWGGPASVVFEIFDLQGHRVRQGYSSADPLGRYTRPWDGCDDLGRRVAPGLYLYRIQVQADVGTTSRQGIVQVVY